MRGTLKSETEIRRALLWMIIKLAVLCAVFLASVYAICAFTYWLILGAGVVA